MTATPRRRRASPYSGWALLALVAGVVLFGASRFSRHVFERPNQAATAPMMSVAPRPIAAGADAVDRDAATLFRVIASEAKVDAFRDGRWIPVPRGELLRSTDVVRTGAGARAVLRLGASTEIELRENVEIRLDRLSATEVSADLLRGKVFAHVARAGDRLTISASETRTSNEGPTHFIVKADETGRVSVAAMEGSARFLSGGKEVIVGPGTESHAERGGVPGDPEKISEEVLLSVIWPEAERHAAKTAITGSVRPSSSVRVNGVPAAVAPDGKFTAFLPLQPGPNDVRVEAEDLSGRSRTSTTTLVRAPPRRPELTPVPGPLWNP